MMKRFKQVLSCETRQGYPLVVAMALGLSVTVISQLFHDDIVGFDFFGVCDAMQVLLLSLRQKMMQMSGVRGGYSGGYQPSAESFNAAVNYGAKIFR